MTRIAIAGATGRMGRLVLQSIFSDPSLECVGAFSHADSKEIDRDAGALVGLKNAGIAIEAEEQAYAGIKNADVLIDFSVAEGVSKYVSFAVELKKPLVIGVTGLPPKTMQQIASAAEQIPIMHEANYSVAVHVLFSLVQKADELLPSDFTAQIVEMHHSTKRDAPSGTALHLHALLHAATRSDVPIHSLRAGGAMGEHSLLFVGADERIEIRHQAQDRRCFAQGALHAAVFLSRQTQCRQYTMQEVLKFLQNNSFHS